MYLHVFQTYIWLLTKPMHVKQEFCIHTNTTSKTKTNFEHTPMGTNAVTLTRCHQGCLFICNDLLTQVIIVLLSVTQF